MNYNKIIIDSSRGGLDSGFIYNKFLEKDFNLDVGRSIYEKLKSLGYEAYLVRDEDTTLSYYERNKIISDLLDVDSSLVISIKVNDEYKDEISVIRSLNGCGKTNKWFYSSLERFFKVKKRCLFNNLNMDYYWLHRLNLKNSEVLVIEIGSSYLKNNNYSSFVDKFVEIFSLFKNNDIYLVKNGDSLYSIAKKLNVDVDKLKDINNLISNRVEVNQELRIPN